MKNVHLLRLAGIVFFAAVFLSPAIPGQNEDWILDKIDVAKRMTSLPFTVSALYRENYLTESKLSVLSSTSATRPNFLLSVLLPPDTPTETTELLQPSYSPQSGVNNFVDKGRESSPTENQSDAMWIKIQGETTAEEKTFRVENSHPGQMKRSKNDVTLAPEDDPESADEFVNANSAHIPEYIPGKRSFREVVLPPTQYVDEPIVLKKPLRPQQHTSNLVPIITTKSEAGLETYSPELMHSRIQELESYANENGYSTEYAFLINLGLKSGKKRFFLVNLRSGTIVNRGLVAHGRGKEKFTLNKHYSNVAGSSCSSLGLYRVGSGYNGGFGKSFRLIGLQKTNNNALSRSIVLHAMSCIPNEEIDYPICQSEGCPSLSPEFLDSISPVIRGSIKPLLLWIFDPAIDREKRLE